MPHRPLPLPQVLEIKLSVTEGEAAPDWVQELLDSGELNYRGHLILFDGHLKDVDLI